MHKIFDDCHSISDFYKKLIEIENNYTPAEFSEIWENKESLSEKIKPSISKTISLMQKGTDEIRPYQRNTISLNVNLYHTESNLKKSLLICFCGVANRLMMPVPVFLQFIPEDQFDVLVIRDPSEHGYVHGIPAFSKDLLETSKLLKEVIDLNRYNDLRCLGTSGGGSAALYFGILMHAKIAISVGGKHRSLSDKVNSEEHLISGFEFDNLIGNINHEEITTQLFAVYGDGSERDKVGAYSLKKYLKNCKLVTVKDIKEHNVLGILLQRNQLSSFLKSFILN